MMKKEWKWEEGYFCLIYLMISLSLIFYIRDKLLFQTGIALAVISTLIMTGVFLLLRLYPKKFLLSFVTLLLTCFFILLMWNKLQSVWNRLCELGGRVLVWNQEEQQFTIGEELTICFFILGTLLLITAILSWRFYIRVTVMLFSTGFMVYSLLNKISIGKQTVIFFVGFMLLILMEIIQKGKKELSGMEQKRAIVFISPFLTGIILLLLIIPAHEKKYDWAFFTRAGSSIVREGKLFSQKIKYLAEKMEVSIDIRDSGYSEDGDLGIGVSQNERIDCILNFDEAPDTTLYLTGSYFSEFEDFKWKQDTSISTSDQKLLLYTPGLEEAEMQYAVFRQNPQMAEQLFYSNQCDVTYQELYTDAVMHPDMTTIVKKDGKKIDYKKDINGLFFQKRQGFESSYRIFFTQLNQGNPLFDSLMETQAGYQYHENSAQEEDFLQYYHGKGQGKAFEAYLEARAAAIYRVYGQAPQLSEKMIQYVDTLTRGYPSDYEKLKAVETELSSYQYTTSPAVDVKDNFPEDFLLKSKEGYCTYYATAFVLIARQLGMPARYVKGYCVTIDGKKQEVLSKNAHAWPEVYFEGVGWVAFEPTPGYQGKRYTQFLAKDFAQNGYTYPGYGPPVSERTETTVETVTKTQTFLQQINIRVIILLVGMVFIVLILAYLLDGIWKEKRYKHLNCEDKITYQLKLILSLLAECKLQMECGETLKNFFERVMKDIPQPNFLVALEVYQKTRYQEKPPTSQDVLIMQEAVREIYQCIFSTQKRRKKVQLTIKLHDFSYLKKLQ